MSDLRAGLHPELLKRIDTVLDRMAKCGHPMKICQGVRTAEYQHELFMKGRDPLHPAKPVTNCDGFKVKSNHQTKEDGFGHAADICFQGNDPFGQSQPWATFGAVSESQGLTWGGRFKLVDLDHVELV